MHVEIWTSTHNRKERHYFIKGGDKGYQHNTYVFGYNPKMVSPKLAKKIKALIVAERKPVKKKRKTKWEICGGI